MNVPTVATGACIEKSVQYLIDTYLARVAASIYEGQ